MYNMCDFKKGCPVCMAVTKSLTKKKCDFCKCPLLKILVNVNSSYRGHSDELCWTWQLEKLKGEPE